MCKSIHSYVDRCYSTAICHTVLRIVRPRILESTFRDHRAKKLDGAL